MKHGARKRRVKPAPLPYDGNPRTVDSLMDRLEAIHQESEAILDELRRQRNRADSAIRNNEIARRGT